MERHQPPRRLARAASDGPHPESGADRRPARTFSRSSRDEPASREDSRALPHARVPRPARALETPTWLDPDTIASETSYEAALLAAGAAIEAVERGGFALVRPPGHHALPDARDGLLPLRQRRRRRPVCPGRARARARRDPRLGRPPRQRDAGDLLGRPVASSSSRCTSGRSTRAPAGRTSRQRDDASTCRFPAGSGDEDYLRAFDESVEPAVRALRARAGARLRRLRRARRRSARGDARHRRRLPRAGAAGRPRSARASQRCSKAATTSRTLPALVDAALEGSRNDNGRPTGPAVCRGSTEPPCPTPFKVRCRTQYRPLTRSPW